MRYVFLFTLFAIYFAILAISFGGTAFLLFYPALSFALLAFAYAIHSPRLLGKRSDGSLSSIAFIVYFPVWLLLWLGWYLPRLFSKNPSYHQVFPQLWIGRRLRGHEVPDSVTMILDLTAEFHEPPGVRKGRIYRAFPILDAFVPSMDEFCRLMDELAISKEILYIHCAAGYGRTGLVACGLLIRTGIANDVTSAEKYLQAVRRRISLNKSQRVFLTQYVEKLQNGD